MTHSFTLSGLGTAPFKVVAPTKNCATFFCEHCGTTLKNQNFVKSSDGKISVVGIDCLKKTGDLGLIAGAKRLAREAAQEARMAKAESERQARQAAERQALGGKTKDEVAHDYDELIKVEVGFLIDEVKATFAAKILEQSNFGTAMIAAAICRDTFTPRMIEVMTDIIAKHISGARKNSQAYKAALPAAKDYVEQFVALPAEYGKAIAEIDDKKRAALAKAA